MRLNNKYEQPRKVKLYIVELDDENREHVFAATAKVSMDVEIDYGDNSVETYLNPIGSFRRYEVYTVTATLIPNDDGTVYTIENFWEQDDDA